LLGESFGPLHHQFGCADVTRRVAVGTGRDHFAFDGAANVGDLLRPLVDEQHDEVHFRMIRRDGGGDVL
jgi:hypothetical protein